MSHFKLKEGYKVTIFVLIMLLFIFTPYVLNFSNNVISKNPQDWGAFGSYLGGLLSPFLAIGSLYYVVKTFKQQSFENTFNLLLEQHNGIAHKITLKAGGRTSTVDDILEKLGKKWLGSERVSDSAYINENPQINSYLRVAYQVLKFIDESCPDDKRKYSRIFRSFLSNELVFLLALNSAQQVGKDKFKFLKYKKLMEEYEILEHLYFSLGSICFDDFKKSNNFLILKRFKESAFGDCINYINYIGNVIRCYIKSCEKSLESLEGNLKNYDVANDFLENNEGFIYSIKESCEKGLTFTSEQNDYSVILAGIINKSIFIKIGEAVNLRHVEIAVGYREDVKDKIPEIQEATRKEYKNLIEKIEVLTLIFTTCKNKFSPREYECYMNLKNKASDAKVRLNQMDIVTADRDERKK